MNQIYPVPYEPFEGEDFDDVTIVTIRASDFNGIAYREGTTTISFIDCCFESLVIKNDEEVDFKHITLLFSSCYIKNLNIDHITTTNISVIIGGSILNGRFKSPNLQEVETNNCILLNSLFLIDIHSARISFSETNIYVNRWKALIAKTGKSIDALLNENQNYYVENVKDVVFNYNESKEKQRGLYRTHYPYESIDRFGYYPTEEDKKRLPISLQLNYSPNIEFQRTKIINAKLSALTFRGFCAGEIVVENSRIDNLYIHELTAQRGAVFFNVMPFRKEAQERKLEILKSNLDGFWFDNVSLDSYTSISLFRNMFGKTTFTSCNFPATYKDFDKFITVENIHAPEPPNDDYYKMRYETFLQLKRQLESSGNFYEAHKFHSVSNEALRGINSIPFWEKFILFFNSKSNNHGLSIKRPFIGLILFSVALYILYLWSLDRMFNANEVDWDLFGFYFSFLDITHRSDFLVPKEEINGWSLFFDYLNKIFVGFFTYQFIAAFRKYGKK